MLSTGSIGRRVFAAAATTTADTAACTCRRSEPKHSPRFVIVVVGGNDGIAEVLWTRRPRQRKVTAIIGGGSGEDTHVLLALHRSSVEVIVIQQQSRFFSYLVGHRVSAIRAYQLVPLVEGELTINQ